MDLCSQIETDGSAIVPNVLPADRVASFILIAETLAATITSTRGGMRNLLDVPEMRELAMSEEVMSLVRPVLGDNARVVRGILFDKTEAANWKVPWHQDVTIAVKERAQCDGFGPWSMKDGVLHVQPPASVMENVLTLRLHLDPCPAENGALRVIAGSHRNGKVSAVDVERLALMAVPTTCAVHAGGALVMRPLLFHASSASSLPGHRRVLHFDYANIDLPCGLQWQAV